MKKFILILVLSFVVAPSVHAACISDPGDPSTCYDDNGDTCTCPATPAPTTGANSGFTALAPIPGLTDSSNTSVVNSSSLANFFNNLYKYLIGLAAVIAIIEIIWGGLEISTQDSVSKHADGKEKIQQAIIGLILVLAPVIVFSIINPSILNLSLNLPALNTATNPSGGTSGGTGTGGGGGGAPNTPDPGADAAKNAGCTITGTLLKTASCPTQQAASDFAAACSTGSGKTPFISTSPYTATCGTESGAVTGPYAFADTSDSTGFTGFINTIVGYSHYDPIASTATNSNNGSAVLQFAATCKADGGTTCMSSIKLPCPVKVVQFVAAPGSSGSCWNISLSCTDGSSGTGGCSSDPQFTVVQTQ